MAFKELNLSNPIHAREFIRDFKLPPDDVAIDRITMLNGRVIVFSRMSDIEAVLAAKALSDILVNRVAHAEKH